jgi:8-oxo-dGTP pyrophosphatase MutT (NUDIX family)
MSHEVKIHDAQMSIIRALLFQPEAGYAELQKPTGLDSDHFKFHIARLVDLGLVEKVKTGRYRLSINGKEFANKLDTDTNTVERQPKISIIIVAPRLRKGTKTTEVLMQQRLKNPYFGFWGKLGGKIRWGETVIEAARRELMEETGLEADLEYKGLYHKMDYREDNGEMLEDKFFLLIKATNCRGALIEEFEGGKNQWMTRAEIDAQTNVFAGVHQVTDLVMKDGLAYEEHKVFYNPKDY